MAPASAATVTVFAAASLTDALKDIAAAYSKESGDTIQFNFAASSTLARQIQAGAPADIFFSADEGLMDALARAQRIDQGTRQSLLSNALVIIVPAQGGVAITSPADLATDTVKRLALAEPRSVPAGMYAKSYLRKQNLWPAIEPKVIPTSNVRAALSTVATGNADAAIVYKTDAATSDKVTVAWEIPARETPDIRYPMAALRGARQPEAAGKFLRHLGSGPAANIFERHGFIILRP